MPAVGYLLVLISAAAFGSMALFARIAYDAGASPTTLMFLRFLVGAIIIGGWLVLRRTPLPRGRSLAGYAFLGGVLYAATAMCYFTALRHASSGLTALLLYTYPALVTGLAAALRLDAFGRLEAFTLALTLAGLGLVLGQEVHGDATGILLGAAAGLMYATYVLGGTRLSGSADPFAAAWVVLASGASTYGLIGSVGGFSFPHGVVGWLAAIGLGVFGSAIGIGTFFAGLARVGAIRASVLSTLEPVVTIALGLAFLKETWDIRQALGGMLVLLAALVLAWAGTRRNPRSTAEEALP